jgi:hypothetical protein
VDVKKKQSVKLNANIAYVLFTTLPVTNGIAKLYAEFIKNALIVNRYITHMLNMFVEKDFVEHVMYFMTSIVVATSNRLKING